MSINLSILRLTDELQLVGVFGHSLESKSGLRTKLSKFIDRRSGKFERTTLILPHDSYEQLVTALHEIGLDQTLKNTGVRPVHFTYPGKLDPDRKGFYCFKEPLPMFTDKIFFLSSFFEILLDFSSEKTDLTRLPLSEYLGPLKFLGDLNYEDFVKTAKFMYTYPMAVFVRKTSGLPASDLGLNELPSIPCSFSVTGSNPFPFHKGKIGRALRNRMVGKKVLRFCQSLLQGAKRGCQSVNESLVFSTFLSHATDLSQPPPPLTGEKRKEIEDALSSPLISILFKRNWSYYDNLQTTEISQSASLQQNRSKGGSRQFLFSKTAEELHPTLSNLIDDDDRKILPDYIDHRLERGFLESVSSSGKSTYSTVKFSPINTFNQVIKSDDEDDDPLTTVRASAVLEPLKVRVISVGDAVSNFICKPVQRYWWESLKDNCPSFILISRPLNGSDFRQIMKAPSFMRKVFKRLFPGIPEDLILFNLNMDFDYFVSGDYKGATDNLSIHISRLIFKSIFSQTRASDDSGLSSISKVEEFLRANLFDTTVEYPKHFNKFMAEQIVRISENRESLLPEKFEVDIRNCICTRTQRSSLGSMDYLGLKHLYSGDPDGKKLFLSDFRLEVEMQNGQLMGSVLSFPILCLSNLLCYLLTWVDYIESQISLLSIQTFITRGDIFDSLISSDLDFPVLINGDDIAFRTNTTFYRFWLKNLKTFGFKPSAGKNYIHNRFVTINSECWEFINPNQTSHSDNPLTWTSEDSPVTFRLIPYLNVGLLRGPNSGIVSVRPSLLSDMPLSDFFAFSVLSSNNKRRSYRRFIHYNLDTIKRMTYGGLLNLFISTHLGGFGFEIHEDIRDLIKYNVSQLRIASHFFHQLKSIKRLPQFQKYKAPISFENHRRIRTPVVPLEGHTFVDLLKPLDVLSRGQSELPQPRSILFGSPGFFRTDLGEKGIGFYKRSSYDVFKKISSNSTFDKNLIGFRKASLLSPKFVLRKENVPIISDEITN